MGLRRVVLRAAFMLAAASLCLAGAGGRTAQAGAQPYATMAATPDPRDFFSRADNHLELLGDLARLAGANLDWLGVRSDTGQAADARMPTAYEVRDALLTVQALGGTIVRARTLGASVGCSQCLMPAPGKYNDAAFAHVDAVLAAARDLGLKIIVPLAGGTQDCARPDPFDGSPCAFVRARGGHDAAAFFTDPAIRADFLAYVAAVVGHVNATTGLPYFQDPTIMAWENCDGCGAGADPAAVSAWSEAVGQAIRAADSLHLYENGAFAGRLDPQSHDAAPPSAWATPSVDIVGDSIPPGGDAVRAASAVTKAGRVYVVDRFAWDAGVWKTQDDLEAFLDRMARQRLLSAALVDGLQGHADGGGYLGAPAAGTPPLYFPGIATARTTAADMQTRNRAIRRFAYRMAEVPTPPFLMPPKPEIIAAVHGRITWRGSAGASSYRIERTSDLVAIGSWSVVCEDCVDTAGPWQDPHLPGGPVWYRIAAADANNHVAPPSPPVQDR